LRYRRELRRAASCAAADGFAGLTDTPRRRHPAFFADLDLEGAEAILEPPLDLLSISFGAEAC